VVSNRRKLAEERKPCRIARILSVNQALHGFYECYKGRIYVPFDCRRKACPMMKKNLKRR